MIRETLHKQTNDELIIVLHKHKPKSLSKAGTHCSMLTTFIKGGGEADEIRIPLT